MRAHHGPCHEIQVTIPVKVTTVDRVEVFTGGDRSSWSQGAVGISENSDGAPVTIAGGDIEEPIVVEITNGRSVGGWSHADKNRVECHRALVLVPEDPDTCESLKCGDYLGVAIRIQIADGQQARGELDREGHRRGHESSVYVDEDGDNRVSCRSEGDLPVSISIEVGREDLAGSGREFFDRLQVPVSIIVQDGYRFTVGGGEVHISIQVKISHRQLGGGGGAHREGPRLAKGPIPVAGDEGDIIVMAVECEDVSQLVTVEILDGCCCWIVADRDAQDGGKRTSPLIELEADIVIAGVGEYEIGQPVLVDVAGGDKTSCPGDLDTRWL